ncbi:helix-turn-helix domain-containing protein [Pedobacter borealis]|uniref:helix-turn-helix domain-containing protein n=1 Tax=Pedobacter borealis TaxID=475254 RepID=UPI00068E981F|nr:helix-turn-helix domain-containing protein [Pedobacter borealis]
MPKTIITTSFDEDEFRALIQSYVQEAVKNEVSKLLNDAQEKLQPNKAYLNRKELAELLDISLVTLGNRTKEGLFPARRIGRKILYKWEDIQNDSKRLMKSPLS